MVAGADSVSGSIDEAPCHKHASGSVDEAPCHKHASACGDAACACSLPGGKLAFILSDGMGKGMKAAAESQAVVTELRKLLKKDVAPSRAIKLVNRKLLDDKENFATLDLIIIDNITGVARFYKMGAASSFLLRNKRVKRIEKAALPIGMIRKIKVSQRKMQLQSGDVLIIVSDGITEADRYDLEANWLQEYLADIPETLGANFAPKKMANQIATIAQKKYNRRETDDITVFVIHVK